MRKEIAFTCGMMLAGSIYAQYITHGPVTGGITHQSARMYVRTGFTNPFVIEVDDDSLFTSPQTINASTDPAKDSTTVVDIGGLQSNTYYYFRCKFNGTPDIRKGRFRTFPQPGEKTDFVLVTGSCQETPNMDVFDRIRETEPLLMLHTGDFTYPSYQLNNSYPGTYSTVQLSWRKRYEEYKMKEMLLTVPIDYIHDDDDGFGTAQHYWDTPLFYTDTAGNVINYFDVDTLPIQGRYNCMRAYTEYFPHYPLPDTAQGLFHSLMIGNTEVFFLDTRSNADPNYRAFKFNTGTQLWEFDPDTSHTLLGSVQFNWLKQGLQNSTADWKILVCGLPFNRQLRILIEFGIFLQTGIFDIGNTQGTGFRLAAAFSNYWAGHPYEQQELLDFLAIHQVKDVVVLSGDTHHNVIDDGLNAGLPELNASGLSVADLGLAYYINEYSATLGYPVLDSLWNGGGNGLGSNPNFLNAFGKVEVFKGDSLRLCVVDEDGNTVACHTVIHSSLVGVPDPTAESFGTVSPNPTTGICTIRIAHHQSYGSKDALYLVNSEGKFIRNLASNIHGPVTFTSDLSDLGPGLYYIIYDGRYLRGATRLIKE